MSDIYENATVFELKSVVEKMQKSMLLAQQANIKVECQNKNFLEVHLTLLSHCHLFNANFSPKLDWAA